MSDQFKSILSALAAGQVVPYLGPGALAGVTHRQEGVAIPADSDSLILTMTGGRPLSPRLMYEFPRAAMHMENKKGRSYLERFLTQTYGDDGWQVSPLHRWIAELKLPYVIDINRDTGLQKLYADRHHTLVVGCARLGAGPYRFELYQWQGDSYRSIELEQVDGDLPVLFKPLGTPLPKPTYVASDADFVDYITELMGGFAIPPWLKLKRRGLQYLFLGMRFNRDTERMVMSDIIYDAAQPAGWALLPNAGDKEKRFCQKKQVQILDRDWTALLELAGATLQVA